MDIALLSGNCRGSILPPASGEVSLATCSLAVLGGRFCLFLFHRATRTSVP